MEKFAEKTLVDKLDKILKKKFGTNLVFREFSAGYGIADLVLAPNFKFHKKAINKTPITNFHCLKLLLSLELNVKYDIDSLQTLNSQFTIKEIKRQLKVLIDSEYIVKKNRNEYVRPSLNGVNNPIKKIIAIEAKLTDHRSGLIQAKRYKYFADESYLAILKEAEKNINIDEFNKYNIGLILFDSNNQSIEIRYPQPVNSHSFENSLSLFAKEMMMSKFINFSF